MQQVIMWLLVLAASAPATTFFVNAAKKAQSFTLVNEGQTARIRSLAALVSVALVAVEHWVSGSLTGADVQQVVTVLLQGLAVWMGSHAAHEVMKPKKD